MPIRSIMPHFLRTLLWCGRARWGLTPSYEDPC